MYHLGFSHFAQKNFTHSFWLNLMMAAILNSSMLDSDTVILDSDTLLFSLRFTQKHSHSTLNLTPTNSIWLIWDVSHLEFCHLRLSHFEQKKTSFIHSHSTSWWQPSSILPSWIQPICKKTLHSFILTHLDDGSHLEFCHLGFRHCHLGFRHLVIFSQIHSKHSHSTLTLNQTNSIWLKLIYSHLTWWWQPSWILPSWIWPSWIQPS